MAAHRLPGLLDRATTENRVGAGEVDELEHAEARRGDRERLLEAGAVLVDDDHLARLDLTDELGADDVQRRRLRGDDPPVVEPSHTHRPKAHRVADADDRVVVHEGQGVRTFEAGEGLAARLDERGARGHALADGLGHEIGV